MNAPWVPANVRHGQQPIAADKLLAFAFRDKPTFRMGFDRHVWQWDQCLRRLLWVRYWNDRVFKAAYDARVAEWQAGVLAA